MKTLFFLLLFLPAVVAQAQTHKAESYPVLNRPDTLSSTCNRVNAAIDTLKASPQAERLNSFFSDLAGGYKKVGKVSLGPLPNVYANNDIEGHRFRVGLKTNLDFSDKWELSGYGAYGTLDKELKYSGTVRYVFSRKKYSEIAITHSSDIHRGGIVSEKFGNSPFSAGYSWFQDLSLPFSTKATSVYLRRDVLPGVTQSLGVSSRLFKPLYDFGYYSGTGENAKLVDNFKTTEISLITRYSKKQTDAQSENHAPGNSTSPVYNLKYTLGLYKSLAGEANYQRIDIGISQQFAAGSLGKTFYRLEAGKIISPVPYPLLEMHSGNETFFYYQQTFNLMDVFEFASDSYASLHVEQHFEGLLTNRLPLIQKLGWRLLTTANVLYGTLNSENRAMLSPVGVNGTLQPTFRTLEKKPYVEIGYGIENIFGFLRVDAIHRLTYLDQPGTSKFGIKFSASIAH